jgi:hypothetical protein
MYRYRGGGTGACQEGQFFINRITDRIELIMPIEDMRQVAMEKRKWHETRVAIVIMDG